MDLMDALRGRRAIREFTDAPVDRATIEALIEAAVLAPSAMNLQPWAFVVVADAARLRGLSARVKQYVQAQLPPDSALAGHISDAQYDIFHGAAALVVVCATGGAAKLPATLTQSNEDCCLAAENFMLAAHDRGLGTCWIGLSRPWLNSPEGKAELGIPADLTPVAPLILGHPRAHPAPTSRNKARIVWC